MPLFGKQIQKYADFSLAEKTKRIEAEYDAKRAALEKEYIEKENDMLLNLKEEQKLISKQKEELLARFIASQNQRRALQQFDEKLKAREQGINERESALDLRESNLADQADALQKQEETLKERVKQSMMRSILAEKEQIMTEIKIHKAELFGIQNMEYKIIDWVSRMENKEREIFDEISADAKKSKECSVDMDGYEFEEFVARILRENGYSDVDVTQKSNDYGADVIAYRDGIKYVFQCKHYSSQVGIEAVQQVYSAKTYYDGHVAIVITNSVFTKAAKVLADELGVVLWDCEKLKELSEEREDS